ncbi:hypothetical protein [Streptomyces avermitilis]|uniref:hypothetical protein n=1 Tax=Streptomyces avermitilis TaxID=33903 RepID=UPI0036A2F073
MIDVYRREPWYEARSEPEAEFVGALETTPAVVGPGNRPALTFLLRTEDDEFPVYASGAEEQLRPLVGQRLRFRGKVVDLLRDAGSRELWIATISQIG